MIQRNILENPGWYTAYTPYQAEIAQGRLEALLNFQTMVTDLTALDIANARCSMKRPPPPKRWPCVTRSPDGLEETFFVADNCHPQTIEVVQTRAKPLGIEIVIGDFSQFKFNDTVFGALVQYPATDGAIYDYEEFAKAAHDAGALVRRRRRYSRADSTETAGRIRGRCCGRHHAAFRRSARLWRTARRLFRDARSIQTAHAGPARRRFA